MAIKHLNPWDLVSAAEDKPVFWEALEDLARLGTRIATMDSNPSRFRGGEGEASMWTGATQVARQVYSELRRATSIGHAILVLVRLKKALPPSTEGRYEAINVQKIIDLVQRTPAVQRVKQGYGFKR